MRVIVGNSLSKVEEVTAGEMNALRSLLAISSETYGGFRPKDPKRFRLRNNLVHYLDLRNIPRMVLTTKGQTLTDIAQAQALAVKPGRVSYRGYGTRLTPLIDRKGVFPTGLLYLVKETYPKAKYVDNRTLPKPLRGVFSYRPAYSPYPEQKAAAEAIRKHHRGIIVAPTALGKSLIVELILNELQVPTLIVVPTLELKTQLRASLTEAFGSDRVGGLGEPIAVMNVDGLDHKKPIKGYGCVIIDEFHHSGAKSYRLLNEKAWGDVYYRIGLTATPFRSRDEERLLLESVLSQVIYRITYADAVAKGRIVPVEAYYREVPEQEMEGNETSWRSVYQELVVNNPIRNEIIANDLISLKDGHVLCLVKEIEHGRTLSDLTGVPFANGKDEGSRELIKNFNTGKIKALIGTTGVIGEGVNTRPAEYVLLAAGGKSKNAFMQQIGRGMRLFPGKESCKIIMYRDASHKWLVEHFKCCLSYLKEEYGVIPAKL